MIKYFLTLVASSASVVALFLTTNFLGFDSPAITPLVSHKSAIKIEPTNLNIASSNLGLTNSHPHILDAKFGCSCSSCLKFS